jgi:integrase
MARKRKAGAGSIRLRKDGRWEGRIVVGYDEKGYPKTKNVLAKTKSACAEKLKELKNSIAPPTPEKAKPSMTLGEWLDHWYQIYKKPTIRPNTQLSYEQRIYNHIIPHLGQIKLEKLTSKDIQQFYTQLKQSGRLKGADYYGEGLSDQTVQGCHSTLRSALAKAVSDKLILCNPADACSAPSVQPREMQILTTEEIQRLLIQAKVDGYYELFLLELATGLRRSEILALQWNDLNFRTGELRVERQVHRVKGELVTSAPKTNAGNRSVILPTPLLNVLWERKMTSDSRWLFPSPVKEDSPLDPSSVRKRLQTILERADCKHVRFHDLRHTFATMSLEHGMDIKTLSAIIGHVSAATTLNIYAHITDEMRQSAARKIDRSIGKAGPTPSIEAASEEAVKKPFQPYQGQRRKPGTGCVSQINDHLWEGRYSPIWPDGKKHPCNVYAHSLEECEKLLANMIKHTKEAITAEKTRLKNQTQTG